MSQQIVREERRTEGEYTPSVYHRLTAAGQQRFGAFEHVFAEFTGSFVQIGLVCHVGAICFQRLIHGYRESIFLAGVQHIAHAAEQQAHGGNLYQKFTVYALKLVNAFGKNFVTHRCLLS